MKIKPSMRYYFLGAVLLLATCMVIAFSALSANYFNEGRDSALHASIIQMAESDKVSAGNPDEIIGFQIASRWQDLSDDIQSAFTFPLKQPHKLNKKAEEHDFFTPPKAGYFVSEVINSKGESRYVAKVLNFNAPLKIYRKGFPHFIWIAIFGFSGIAIFSLLLLLIMRTVAKPIEALHMWASLLNEKNLQQSPPDFHYNELNTLAQIVHNSLNSVQETLNREHDFLRYASHELRTPIAVIRTNVELLRKINEREEMSDKQMAVVQRIERAGFTMSHLTETLLWLSRGNNIPPVLQVIQLNELVLRLTEELNYLLLGKSVEVQITTSEYALELPETACRIVLANLIRNAFQHTQSGMILITQEAQLVKIESKNIDNAIDETDSANDELGFGLGLKLTDKLIQQFDWQYQSNVQQTGYSVEVSFS